jgi:hypothetical protein
LFVECLKPFANLCYSCCWRWHRRGPRLRHCCTGTSIKGGVPASAMWDIDDIGNTSLVSESELDQNAVEKMALLLSDKETW